MTTANTSIRCPWCGGVHMELCPHVKAIDYYENGGVRRIEFRYPQPASSIGTVFVPTVFPVNSVNTSSVTLAEAAEP